MPRYRYIAEDAEGRPQSGRREAKSPEALTAALQGEGLRVQSVEPMAEESARGDRLSDDDAQALAEQVAGLARAGLPLHSGLRALATELPDGALRRAVRQLADRLEAGEPLDDAIEALGPRFPAHLHGLLLAGVRSGRMGDVLGEFVTYTQLGASLRRSVWLSLAYPILLFSAFVLVFVYLAFVIVDGFQDIYKDFGISIPWATRLLFEMSDTVKEAGWAVVTLPLAAVVLGWLSGKLLLDPVSRHWLARRLPLFGPLWRWTSLAEFSHYLGLLLECQLSLVQALPLAAAGTRDAGLALVGQQIAVAIESGRSLAESLSWRRIFPGGFAKMLQWAEGHQSLPETLHMAAEMFEARARSQASFIGSVCAVIAVIFVLWGCGFLVVALFWPLLQLIRALSG